MKAVLEKAIDILKDDVTLAGLMGGSVVMVPDIPDQLESFPCIVYSEAGSTFRTVPRNTEDVRLVLKIYTKDTKMSLENIYARINALLNYYTDTTPTIVYMRQSVATDANEQGRDLKGKVVQYQIWSRNV